MQVAVIVGIFGVFGNPINATGLLVFVQMLGIQLSFTIAKTTKNKPKSETPEVRDKCLMCAHMRERRSFARSCRMAYVDRSCVSVREHACTENMKRTDLCAARICTCDHVG